MNKDALTYLNEEFSMPSSNREEFLDKDNIKYVFDIIKKNGFDDMFIFNNTFYKHNKSTNAIEAYMTINQMKESYRDYVLLSVNKKVGFQVIPTRSKKAYVFQILYENNFFKRVENIVFRADRGAGFFDEDGRSFFNQWGGFIQTNVNEHYATCQSRIFLEYLKELTAYETNKDEAFNYLLSMLAYSVQKPSINLEKAILLRGYQGFGKSTLPFILSKICPRHFKELNNIEDMTGFNDLTEHMKYVEFVEATTASYAIADAVKQLCTNQTRTIEAKYGAKRNIANIVFPIFTSNSNIPLIIEPDDRRIFVLDIKNNAKSQELARTIRIKLLTDSTFAECIYYFLEKYKPNITLNDVIQNPALKTDAKTKLSIYTMTKFSKFFVKLIDNQYDDIQFNENEITKINRNILLEIYNKVTNSSITKKELVDELVKHNLLSLPEKWFDNWKSGGKPYYKFENRKLLKSNLAEFFNMSEDFLFEGGLSQIDMLRDRKDEIAELRRHNIELQEKCRLLQEKIDEMDEVHSVF